MTTLVGVVLIWLDVSITTIRLVVQSIQESPPRRLLDFMAKLEVPRIESPGR